LYGLSFQEELLSIGSSPDCFPAATIAVTASVTMPETHADSWDCYMYFSIEFDSGNGRALGFLLVEILDQPWQHDVTRQHAAIWPIVYNN
jgi:hypothetical protein